VECQRISDALPYSKAIGLQLAVHSLMDEALNYFGRNPDGSWTCTAAGTFNGPGGRIQVTPGSRFYPGTMFMGFDVALWLEALMEHRAGAS
jgi:hypothetical protein